ncbi:nitronate monooxygenase [Pseudarcicella hirudinis]|uniref:Nitronate monooxygenase n=1 Tax=Pseudarcicella hirudinis TaxID=1079859 RepID=A0A1I5UWU2_9BACT|nr:nitronate monooxygenase [Pseudarcicella hirudinis]SFP99701.1 nitronate monooxygenase [Pseudarcicella hirudinis]
MKINNELTRLLKIAYPVIQAPMLGATTPEMVAKISNLGGLGSLPVGGLSPAKTAELIRKTKTLTNQPFAVNLFANSFPQPDVEQFDRMQVFLEKYCADNHIRFERMSVADLKFYPYEDQIDILLSENIPVVSFTFGIINDEAVRVLKEKGVVLIGTATSLKEAGIIEEKGIDMITAQGIEAGGHRGSFLSDESLPQTGLMTLLPKMTEQINRPVLAAGGINSGKTIKAAFVLGAQGVQIGTAFLGSDESLAFPAYKAALANGTESDTALTKAFSGRWARGIRNTFMDEIEKAGLIIPEYPIQNSLTTLLRRNVQEMNNTAFTNLWAGQSHPGTELKPVEAIFQRLIKEYDSLGE